MALHSKGERMRGLAESLGRPVHESRQDSPQDFTSKSEAKARTKTYTDIKGSESESESIPESQTRSR